jgi:hypothetical protein
MTWFRVVTVLMFSKGKPMLTTWKVGVPPVNWMAAPPLPPLE